MGINKGTRRVRGGLRTSSLSGILVAAVDSGSSVSLCLSLPTCSSGWHLFRGCCLNWEWQGTAMGVGRGSSRLGLWELNRMGDFCGQAGDLPVLLAGVPYVYL